MPSAVGTSSYRTRSEESALRAVIDRLVQQFPEVAADDIVKAVHGRYEEFEDSRVRDFIPVLVERAARGDVTAQVPRHRA